MSLAFVACQVVEELVANVFVGTAFAGLASATVVVVVVAFGV